MNKPNHLKEPQTHPTSVPVENSTPENLIQVL
ncbi:hypothetical protein SAMN05216324_10921 [Chryseobacterium limigenitum]|uniref:Uncharacterized protein n=1 Tax=Chryseobacterium limigenitum TaxID=1612149 RepID=A0A1K2IS15_9FLAO|nr:hypothetical protein SAMN05216324_10921 [Chryseobacterium limigenitum]